MISVCIPVYNYDVTRLVTGLKGQADLMNIPYEIRLYDDGSNLSFKNTNRNLADLTNVIYKELPENIGRSAIRNLLAKEARYKYLIFMDCDASLCSSDYIGKYIPHCNPGIVCYGGLKSPSYQPNLRWYFTINREEKDAETRNKNPNINFTAFNTLIDSEVFEKVNFDESLTGYGHEDTLFGIELAGKNIKITHIDNPLIHTELESAEIFLVKTKQSIRNLLEIAVRTDHVENLQEWIKLLKVEKKISKLKLTLILSIFYNKSNRLLEKHLTGKKPSLFIFDLYKLSYLCHLKIKQKKWIIYNNFHFFIL